jgi:hypothetical protein
MVPIEGSTPPVSAWAGSAAAWRVESAAAPGSAVDPLACVPEASVFAQSAVPAAAIEPSAPAFKGAAEQSSDPAGTSIVAGAFPRAAGF